MPLRYQLSRVLKGFFEIGYRVRCVGKLSAIDERSGKLQSRAVIGLPLLVEGIVSVVLRFVRRPAKALIGRDSYRDFADKSPRRQHDPEGPRPDVPSPREYAPGRELHSREMGLFNRGQIHQKLGHFGEAISDYAGGLSRSFHIPPIGV